MAELRTIELTRQRVKRLGLNLDYYPLTENLKAVFRNAADDGPPGSWASPWTVTDVDEFVIIPSRTDGKLHTVIARITETMTYTIDMEPR